MPTRYDRQTLGSVMASCAAREEAPAPMSCSGWRLARDFATRRNEADRDH